MTVYSEPAPAKLNLALHVRGKLPDGRHAIETVFAFCTEGDMLSAELADELSLTIDGPFAEGLPVTDNLVLRAAQALRKASGTEQGAALHLKKNLPVASGIGGGSADAAAALRLLTRIWNTDPKQAAEIAPALGSDVPACLLSKAARGTGAGEQLQLVDDSDFSGAPVLLVNPLIELRTSDVFARWDGVDRGPLRQWNEGRNDLEHPARSIVSEIDDVLRWLRKQSVGDSFVRMSGSGATCFAILDSERTLASVSKAVPEHWWHLATHLR